MYRIRLLYTSAGFMRTNIDIDDDLLEEAMAISGLATKRATVEEGLRLLVAEQRRRDALRALAGIGWEGDLNALRRDDTGAAA